MEKYPVGTKLEWLASDGTFYGIVVGNVKLPGDVCVRWGLHENDGPIISYDEDFLDKHVNIRKV